MKQSTSYGFDKSAELTVMFYFFLLRTFERLKGNHEIQFQLVF
jgi:hypothetical protein